jgi:type II secretory ATPase GspE/PulE/Tfp pilus assembly ATPase PilB-like protein
METEGRSSTVEELERKVARAEHVKEIINRIHSAKDLDHIVVDLKDEILQVLDAELLTLYVVDAERREIYSKFLDINKIREIRVPISEQSIAGFAAKFRRPVNIADAYSRAELRAVSPALAFDSSWDRKSGFRTKQILTYPIVADGKYLMGVIQLVNKKSGGRFTQKDEDAVAELAQTLGIAFFNRLKVSRRIPTKFDYLVAHNRITQADLEQAIREAQQGQVDVETVLLEQYQVPRADIGKSLSQFYRCPFVEYDGATSLDPTLLDSVNPETLRNNGWIPLKHDKDGVHILSDDPNNLNRIQDIKRTFPGRPIRFAVGLRADILRFLDAVTGPAGRTPDDASVADTPSRSVDAEAPVSVATAPLVCEAAAEDTLDEVAHQREPEMPMGQTGEDQGREPGEASEAAGARVADQIMRDACRVGASHVHLEPQGSQQACVIRFRVDGLCVEHTTVPAAEGLALVAHCKAVVGLDPAERRAPQEGRGTYVVDNREVALRVATLPTAGSNEDLVMHLLPASVPMSLDQLGLAERNLHAVHAIASKPAGLFLCGSPPGAGATAALGAILGAVDAVERKVWSIQDPIEMAHTGLRRVQVQPAHGVTVAAAVRAALRADPDVIAVDAVRTQETWDALLEAALAGHLVLGTLRAGGAAETVSRLLDLGLDCFGVADALVGVLAQRLCRAVCAKCREAYHPPKEDFDELARVCGLAVLETLGYTYTDGLVLYRGTGCDLCRGSGLHGRLGLHELLLGTDRIKRAILKRATAEQLRKVAVDEGMTTLLQDGAIKVLQGRTTLQQVRAATIA